MINFTTKDERKDLLLALKWTLVMIGSFFFLPLLFFIFGENFTQILLVLSQKIFGEKISMMFALLLIPGVNTPYICALWYLYGCFICFKKIGHN